MSRVLVLLCTYQGASHLRAQLDSLAGQSVTDWALWVSDDGSTDGTRAIVEGFAEAVPQPVVLVAGPGQGASANFLSLLCHPDLPLEAGTCVALSDQDDEWYPDKLARALHGLDGIAGPAIYGAGYDRVAADGTPLGRSPGPPPGGLRATDPFTWNPIGGLTAMLNADAVALARRAGPVAVPHHDWWLTLLVAASGGRMILDPQPVLAYRQHEANVMGANAGRGARGRRIKAVLDGRYGAWVRTNAASLLAADAALTPEARDLAEALSRPAGPMQRLATIRRHRLRRRDRAGTLAMRLAAMSGRL